jgi:hypothetical protein
MFFRRETPKILTFRERIDGAGKAGFSVENDASGHVRVTRGDYAAVLADTHGGIPVVQRVGLLMGKEIGELVSGGYQMFFMTAAGRRTPALASHLHELHDFKEDLSEALGLESLYNESLGTTSAKHLYDRVEERDDNKPKEPWRAVKADAVFVRK